MNSKYDVYEFDKTDPHQHLHDFVRGALDQVNAGHGNDVLEDLNRDGKDFAVDLVRGMMEMRDNAYVKIMSEVCRTVDAGDLEGALAVVDKALKTGSIDPEHVTTMKQTAYERAGEPEMELETLKGDKRAHGFRYDADVTELLYRLDRYDELADWFDKWKPANDEDDRAAFLLTRARLAHMKGDAAAAKRQADAILDEFEFGPEANELFGDILADEGDLRGAVVRYNKALDQDYNIIYPHIKKAKALVKMGRSDAAALACRRGLAIRPQNKMLKKILAES